MKKNWIGRYGYSFEEGNEWYYSFEITANYNNGSFEGTVIEEEFTSFTNDLVHVKGFIEEDLISFVKTYPYLFEANDNGEMLIDKSQRGHSVIYQGYYDQSKDGWEGEWEVKISEESDKTQIGAYKTQYKTGPWNMKLK